MGTRYYSIVFRDQEKREVRLFGGHTKKDAQTKLGRVKAEVREGTWIHPDELKHSAGPTFAKFAERFVEEHITRSSYYEEQLRESGPLMAYWGERRVREVTRADLDWYKAKRSKEVGPSTVRKNLTILGTMFKHRETLGRDRQQPSRRPREAGGPGAQGPIPGPRRMEAAGRHSAGTGCGRSCAWPWLRGCAWASSRGSSGATSIGWPA